MRPFEPGDVKDFLEWHRERGLDPAPPELLPFGLVVPNSAMGFVYVAGPVACMEGIITNPEARSVASGRAVREIVFGLMAHARRQGAKVIFGPARMPSIGRLAKNLGWAHVGSYDVWAAPLR